MAGSSDYMRKYSTPKSNKRQRKSSTSSRFASGVDTLAQMAANAAGYGSQYKVAKLTMKGAKRLFTKNKTEEKANTKVSYVKGTSGSLAGKMRKKGKKVTRKYIPMVQQGILTREEFRFQDNVGTQNESRLIGHTSLPVRATWYNIFRALVKCIFAKAGVHMPALTDTTDVKGELKVSFFTDWTTGSFIINTYTIPANAGQPITWKVLADGFADHILTLGASNYEPDKLRFKYIEYIPETAFSKVNLSRVQLSFSQMYCTIHSKSMLKFQNQSAVYKVIGLLQEDVAATSDEVDNVPVELSTYYVTGNQFIHQNARTSAAVGLGFLGFDQTFTNSTVGSEPCPAHEILNCTNKTKITMDPGHIKTSIISYKKKLLFSQLIRMLVRRDVTGQNWVFQDTGYVKSLGHCRALHVDRVIGAFGGKVRLQGEVELKQQVMVQGSLNTATDQYEIQRE